MRYVLGQLAPNVINVHYASGYGSLAHWCAGIPVVLNVWGSDVFEFPDKSAVHRWWLLQNLSRAAHVVSTSTFMAQRTRSLSTVLPPLTVVPFGVDTRVFLPAVERSAGPVIFGTVKTLAEKYAIDVLIRAFAQVLSDPRCSDACLRIVGTGPQEQELRALAADLGIGQRVDFVGAVAHGAVPEQLQRLDVFVALSRADSETFGVAVVEASAVGIPVVVSDAGGLPEVVMDGSTGCVVPRNDVEAAARCMLALALSPERRAAMGAAGRARVVAHYGWEHCVDRQLMVLEHAARA